MSGDWVTPRLDDAVAGVMRRAFRQWRPNAARRLPTPDRRDGTRKRGVPGLTNSLIGAWPVRELAGQLTVDPIAGEFNAWLARV
jgi:hypothetical protein